MIKIINHLKKSSRRATNLLLVAFIFYCNINAQRIEQNFNDNWKFFTTKQNFDQHKAIQHQNWNKVNIPHDWMKNNPYNQAKKIYNDKDNTSVIGWYKKEFHIPKKHKNRFIRLDFDGIYNNSTIYLNGKKIGERPYGFSPFSCNLSKHLKFGEPNILLIKVDRRAFLDSRWYNGGGIYRNVKLVNLPKTHIKKWGTTITTANITLNKATIVINTNVNNFKNKKFKITVSIFNDTGKKIISNSKLLNNQNLKININHPKLWSPKTPNLYTANIKITNKQGKILDNQNTVFGIRTLKYTANNGFYLNGKKTLFKGVCLHQDAGVIGTAIPNDIWKRRLNILKKAGVNAIRTAHNPPSNAFLNLCDELGFMVQDEAFDEFDYPKDKRKNYKAQLEDKYTKGYTEHFQTWGKQDLQAMVNRDKNHPSIVMWSIGNEIEWTYPRYGKSSGYFGSTKKYYYDEPPITIDEMKQNMLKNPSKKYELAKTAQNLSKWVKEIDTTRPVTANLVIPTISHFSGYTDALDIIGYSYRASVYQYGHKHYPNKMILGTENWASYVEWKSIEENPFVPGVFLWAGIHYMGETKDAKYRGSDSGLLDFAGFKTPRWYLFKTLWVDEPEIYMTTIPLSKSEYKIKNHKVVDKTPDLWRKRRWDYQPFNTHYNYKTNDSIVVETYTNCKFAELFLNGKSLGKQKLANNIDHIIKWVFPYEPGELKIVGDNKTSYTLNTAKQTNTIQLQVDKTMMNANNTDVTHIVAQLYDEHNNPVKHIEKEITFNIEGPARFLGLDNGNNILTETTQSTTGITCDGKILLLIQSTYKTGTIKITANSNNIKSKQATITVH